MFWVTRQHAPAGWLAGKPSSLELSWTSPNGRGHQHLYLNPPIGLTCNVSEREMLVVHGDHHRRTLAHSFQNLLSHFWGHATQSCLARLSTLFLLFPFASVKPVPPCPTTVQCFVGHDLADLDLLFSHYFPDTPQEYLLLPLTFTWPRLQDSVQSYLLNKTFWTLGLA